MLTINVRDTSSTDQKLVEFLIDGRVAASNVMPRDVVAGLQELIAFRDEHDDLRGRSGFDTLCGGD